DKLLIRVLRSEREVLEARIHALDDQLRLNLFREREFLPADIEQEKPADEGEVEVVAKKKGSRKRKQGDE
ncbi:hypothetical protein FOMPIDRAFT_1056795, partial [Fomitopsis schrenkii]